MKYRLILVVLMCLNANSVFANSYYSARSDEATSAVPMYGTIDNGDDFVYESQDSFSSLNNSQEPLSSSSSEESNECEAKIKDPVANKWICEDECPEATVLKESNNACACPNSSRENPIIYIPLLGCINGNTYCKGMSYEPKNNKSHLIKSAHLNAKKASCECPDGHMLTVLGDGQIFCEYNSKSECPRWTQMTSDGRCQCEGNTVAMPFPLGDEDDGFIKLECVDCKDIIVGSKKTERETCECTGPNEYAVRDEITNELKCRECEGEFDLDGECVPCHKGSFYNEKEHICEECKGDVYNGRCEPCYGDTKYSEEGHKCIKDCGEARYENGKCVCPEGSIYQYHECVKCEGDVVDGKCKPCAMGKKYSEEEHKCIKDCGEARYEAGKCVCPENQVFNEEKKKCECDENSYESLFYNGCVKCPDDADKDGIGCKCKDERKQFDKKDNSCKCKDRLSASAYNCEQCKEGYEYDSSLKECRASCGNNAWYNHEKKKCECKSGYGFLAKDSRKFERLGDSRTDLGAINGAQCQECPAGTKLVYGSFVNDGKPLTKPSGDKTVPFCKRRCATGSYWNVKTGKCTSGIKCGMLHGVGPKCAVTDDSYECCDFGEVCFGNTSIENGNGAFRAICRKPTPTPTPTPKPESCPLIDYEGIIERCSSYFNDDRDNCRKEEVEKSFDMLDGYKPAGDDPNWLGKIVNNCFDKEVKRLKKDLDKNK